MLIRERYKTERWGRDSVRPVRRSRPHRPTRWRPGLEGLEQYTLLSAANLVVSAAVAPTVLHTSETFQVSWGVTNRGTEAADANWSDAVYLSKDVSLDGADTLLDSPRPAWTTLAPGESYSQDAALPAPAADSGDYYLLFVADSGGDQAESDEGDNVRAVPVNLVGASSSLPDLIVTDATAPSSAVIGNINVSWTVKNQGTADVAGYWYDSFYLSTNSTYDPSDTLATTYYHSSSLAAGASQSFTTGINLPSDLASSYYLLIVADGVNYVSESDETNNVRAVPITLSVPNVDLVVTAADAPATAKAGGPAAVSWTVKNQGTDAASASWTDGVYLSADDKYDSFDSYVSSFYVYNPSPLDPGASYSRNPTITLPAVPAGSYYILFLADSGHNQAETVETNNIRAVPITLTPLDVDLEVTAATAPATAKPGPVEISWTVKNQGTDPVAGYWTDYVYLSRDQTYDSSDRYVTSSSHYGNPPLGAGESSTVTLTANLPGLAPGDYYLLFIADQYSNVSETDEINNTRAVPITLTASSADLAVTAADAPATARAGGPVDISWTIENRGPDAATSGWVDAVYLSTDQTHNFSDQYLAVWFVSSPLAADASKTYSTSATLPTVAAGQYYLLFITDVGSNQAETDEINNLRVVPITIEAADTSSPVDLAVANASAPASASPGQYVSVSWVVTNVGTDSSDATWMDAVYLSSDATLDTATDTLLATIATASQSPLPDGRSYIVSMDIFLPAGTAAGDYHLLFVTNSGEDQAESSRANNLADRMITLATTAAPAPTLSSFTVNDGEAQRSMVTHLTLMFSGVVTIDSDAFRLVREDGTVVGLVESSQVVDGQTVVTLTFDGAGIVGGSLADGRYTLTAFADRIHDATGQSLDGDGDGTPAGDHIDHLFRLFGDADGDGDVDNKDYFAFRTTAGKQSGDKGFLWFLDSNGDGIVDLATDYAAFKTQNRKTLA